jgi:hypothetical protein
MGENQITIGEYAKEIIYFDGLTPQDAGRYVDLVEQEAEKSISYFRNAGWNADKKDITETEKGWNPGVFSSIQITSSNNIFNCQHTITASNKWGAEATGSAKKREMVECSIQPSMLGQVVY